MKLGAFIIAVLALSPFASASAQSRAVLRQELAKIDSVHQVILDSGVDNMANEDWYNSKMDQLLNKAYRVVLEQSNSQQKQSLKIEQRAWLKQRDKNTKQARREITRENGEGTLTEQVTYGEEADFVHKRVLYLINKIKF